MLAETTTSVLFHFTCLISYIDSAEPTGACLIALDGQQAVATLGLRLREPGAYVNSLYVAPAYQRRGLATQLLQRAAGIAQQFGKPTMGLAVHDNNLGARRLYESLGFRAHEFGNEGYTRFVAMLPLQVASRYPACQLAPATAA